MLPGNRLAPRKPMSWCQPLLSPSLPARLMERQGSNVGPTSLFQAAARPSYGFPAKNGPLKRVLWDHARGFLSAPRPDGGMIVGRWSALDTVVRPQLGSTWQLRTDLLSIAPGLHRPCVPLISELL